MAGLGGAEALQQLSGFTMVAGGVRWPPDEGLVPGGTADKIGPFEVQVNYDITGDALRLDYNLESRGQPRHVREVIAGALGYIEGVDVNNGQPGPKNMSSDYLTQFL